MVSVKGIIDLLMGKNLTPIICGGYECTFDAPPNSLMDPTMSPKMKTAGGEGVEARSLVHDISGVEGCARALGWGLGRLTNNLIIHTNLYKPNNKLVNAWLEHLWCMDEPQADTDTQDSPRPGLGGSHHIPLYSILYAWPWANTKMSFCPGTPKWKSRNSQNWDSCNFGGL